MTHQPHGRYDSLCAVLPQEEVADFQGFCVCHLAVEGYEVRGGCCVCHLAVEGYEVKGGLLHVPPGSRGL